MRTTLVCSHPEYHSGRKRGRNSFRSVKKTVTATGQARFDAEHDEKFGHADHWWAFCVAESAHVSQTYEEVVVFEPEPISISPELDEFDLRNPF
jgi:phage FluMu gp28-like protein